MTLQEMEALLSEGIGGAGVTPDRATIKRDLWFLLTQSVDPGGDKVDPRYFSDPKKSAKDLDDLCVEILNYDCAVKQDRETRRLQRLARSTKVHVESEGFELLEEYRRYDNGKKIPTNEDFALSETMKLKRSLEHISPDVREHFRLAMLRHSFGDDLLGNAAHCETPAEAARRALLEEPEIYVPDPLDIDVDALAHLNRGLDDPRILRESRVFYAMQSRVATYHALVRLPEVPERTRMGIRHRDTKVWVYAFWHLKKAENDNARSLAATG